MTAPSYHPVDRAKARNHKEATGEIVGRGPKVLPFNVPHVSPPSCAVGERVDVLLNDGRILRTRVARSPYCGGVWLDGVRGHVRVTRVRAPGGWAPVSGVTYTVEVPDGPPEAP